MKKILLVGLILHLLQGSGIAQHEIKVKINGIKDTVCYLAGYYGPKQYYKDTADVDSQGNMVFKGEKNLPGGIYSVVLPDKGTYFEFLVTEQKFSLETSKSNLVNAMKVKGSKENALFYGYLNFINKEQVTAGPLRKVLQDSTATEAQKKEAKEKLSAIDKKVREYKTKFMTDNPSSFAAKIFLTSKEPDVPEAPVLENGRKDSTFPRKYYMSHFWDNTDWADERLIRTPVMANKLTKYMTKLVVQHPDSINRAADYLINQPNINREIYKYFVHYITNNFEKSKIMGMDGVFVHMAKTVYCQDKAWWVDSAQKAKICERAKKLGPLLIGLKAPNVILQDTSEQNWINMYEIEANYTVLMFWDPSCGHCKKVMPQLKEIYSSYKPLGVEFYSVCTEFETKDWKKFVIDKELKWINVSDNPEINKNAAKYLHLTTLQSLNFRDTYDVYSTPVIYLLDKDKKILAKRLGAEQLEELIRKFLTKDGVKKLPAPSKKAEIKKDKKQG